MLFVPRSRSVQRQAGYTLLEMMIVVVIIGILAAVAIPSFTHYLQKSKTSEAISFIATIRQRQASYFAEMGQYCNVSGAAVWNPVAALSEDPVAWTTNANWTQLGAAPDGFVRFRYQTLAGGPGLAAPPAGRGLSANDFWFIAAARADLDMDGTLVTFEAYSGSTNMWVSADKGWD